MSLPTREVLLVVEGAQLSDLLTAELATAGFRTTAVRSGRAALAAIRDLPIDAVLLELTLPDMQGKEVITLARRFCQTPIIVLSANASEEENIEALDLGANDFLTYPLSIPELLARLRVATRAAVRSGRQDDTGGISFDFNSRSVTVGGRSRRLTGRETDLLRLLAAAEGGVVSHEVLIEGVWGDNGEANISHLRVLAWQIRRKIEPDASNPRFLLVEPSRGYRLAGVRRKSQSFGQ